MRSLAPWLILVVGAVALAATSPGDGIVDISDNDSLLTPTASPIRQVEVINFPNPQNVAGTVDVGNLPSTQEVVGTVNVGNLPAVQTVNGSVSLSNLPVDVNGNLLISPPQPSRHVIHLVTSDTVLVGNWVQDPGVSPRYVATWVSPVINTSNFTSLSAFTVSDTFYTGYVVDQGQGPWCAWEWAWPEDGSGRFFQDGGGTQRISTPESEDLNFVPNIPFAENSGPLSRLRCRYDQGFGGTLPATVTPIISSITIYARE